jgi:uncharacterized membrane protein
MKALTAIGMRKTVNIVLPLAALGVMAFYGTCSSTCSSLTGDIFGLDMKYLGLIIPIPLVILAIFSQDLLLLMALSFGTGAELKLISFQVFLGQYCPYCLTFGAIIIFLFLFNLRRSRKLPMAAFLLLGFLLFQLFFHGSAVPTYAMAPVFRGIGVLV